MNEHRLRHFADLLSIGYFYDEFSFKNIKDDYLKRYGIFKEIDYIFQHLSNVSCEIKRVGRNKYQMTNAEKICNEINTTFNLFREIEWRKIVKNFKMMVKKLT